MKNIIWSIFTSTVICVLLLTPVSASAEKTRISIEKDRWYLNGGLTYPSTQAEGLLMNVRMVNAVFEDKARSGFDANEYTSEFINQIPVYVAHGVRAFTINLQGGFPGYEGAINSAFKEYTNYNKVREYFLKMVNKAISIDPIKFHKANKYVVVHDKHVTNSWIRWI